MPPRPKKNSKKSNVVEAQYPQSVYSVYGVSDGTTKSKASIISWVQSPKKSWISDAALCEPSDPESTRKAPYKGKAGLLSAVDAACQKQLRHDRKVHLKPFIVEVRKARDLESVAQWFQEHALVLDITEERLSKWEDDGFSVASIFTLVDSRNMAIKSKLKLTEGAWQALLTLYNGVVVGDIKFDSDMEIGGNVDDDDINEKNSGGGGGAVNTRRRKRKRNSDEDDRDSDADNDDRNRMRNHNGDHNGNHEQRAKKRKLHHHYAVPRGVGESASNHWVRSRQGNKHPYFVLSDSADTEFHIARVHDDAKNLEQFTSSLRDRYCYDEEVDYFQQDAHLLRTLMLNKHGLWKLHARLTAQSSLVNVFTGGRKIGDKSLRYSGKTEYRVGACIGEYVGLLVRVKQESNVWKAHSQLVSVEPKPNNYQVAEHSNLLESGCRLPQSQTQIDSRKKKNDPIRHSTYWFLRKSPLNVKDELSEEEFKKIVLRWKTFGVLRWMKQYIGVFFPGDMERALEAGLVEDASCGDNHAVLKRNDKDEKDDDNLFDFI